jgi:hypothetical protein
VEEQLTRHDGTAWERRYRGVSAPGWGAFIKERA